MLRYDELEMSEFTGMWLNNVSYFRITFKEIITLVLGRNGSGKSRLMNQISPLCPEKLDFRDGGSKRIVITKDENQYELKFNRVKGSYKCYIKNLTTDEEITNGSNPTVHNTVVKELFGYDKELHMLFTGKVLLTDLKTPERKKWFSKLSTSDLSFALQFYKKAKENLRDITGTIKTLRFSIGELRPRVIEDAEVLEQTRNRIEILQKDISQIDIILSGLNTDPIITEDYVMEHLRQLERSFKRLAFINVTKDPAIGEMTSEAVSVELSRVATSVEHLNQRMVKIEEVLNQNKLLQTVDIAALEKRLEEREETISNAEVSITMFPKLTEYSDAELRTATAQIREHAPRLIELMSALDCDIATRAIPQLSDEADKYSADLQTQINKCSNRIASRSDYLKNITNITEVECGKCNHRFKPGLRENEIELVKHDLQVQGEQLEKLNHELESLNKRREKYAILRGHLNDLRNLINYLAGYTPIKLLLDELSSVDGFYQNQRMYAGIIHTFVSDVEKAEIVAVNTNLATNLRQEIAIAKATQNNDVSDLLKEKATIEHQLDRYSQENAYLQNIRKLIQDYEQRMSQLDLALADFERMEKRADELEEIVFNNIDASVLIEQKNELWNLLTETKQRYDTMERERIRLEDQETQLAQLEKRMKNAKAVVDAMSPDGGLLAKYLYNSITRITELMSEYINRMWGYDMHIQPCDVSDGDMDYLFPFWAGSKDKMNADVSMGSRGQRDVINFVFMLAVYRAMDLKAYPLLIDEALAAFDETHRDKAIDFIKHLIGTGKASQVVMVSHDANTHFKLTTADICVLDSEGVTLPSKYNTNVEII